MARPWQISRLAELEYSGCYEAMKTYTETRDADSSDQLWLLEHSPVYTQGQAGKPEHVLLSNNIPIVQSDRGGQVTYHGPGQLVGYLLVDIDRIGVNTRKFVERVEDALTDAIRSFGIAAEANRDAHGVYVQVRDELAQDHPSRALSDRELITAVDKACCLALSQHFPELDLGLDEQR